LGYPTNHVPHGNLNRKRRAGNINFVFIDHRYESGVPWGST
jgi:hypothetical protein